MGGQGRFAAHCSLLACTKVPLKPSDRCELDSDYTPVETVSQDPEAATGQPQRQKMGVPAKLHANRQESCRQASAFVPPSQSAQNNYSNSSITISGLEPRRNGGPQVPAPLDVNTCIFPMRLSPYTNCR